MLQDWPEMDSGIVQTCPRCKGEGPAQYRHTCHCNHCGYEWNTKKERDRDAPRCVMANGDVLEWNNRIELWVDIETGATYEPGKE